MRKAILAIGLFLVGIGVGRPAQAITQRHINTLAACLYQTTHLLIEAPGVRRPQEPIPDYFARLLAPLPNEKPAARHARVAGYLTLLAQTVDRTAALRKIPTLQTASASNKALWQLINRNVLDLSACLEKLRLDWAQEENRPAPPSETVKIMAQTIWHMQNAYAALRDALP